MKTTRAERETHVWRADDEDRWSIYTESPPIMRRLRTLAATHGIDCEAVEDYGVRARIPKAWLRITPTRDVSDAQRAHLQAMAEKAGAARQTTAVGQEGGADATR
jgi:hypothetical protein